MRIQNKPVTTQCISYLLIILLIIFVGYLLINNSNSKLIDTKHYEKKVDSLNGKIEYYDSKIDLVEKSIEIYVAKTAQYDIELANLKNNSEIYKKQYEESINRINIMSNSDLEREFTNTFK